MLTTLSFTKKKKKSENAIKLLRNNHAVISIRNCR